MTSLRFVDLFAGLGGFHVALSELGHECVFACEINEELREIYKRNFESARSVTYGDIRKSADKIPPHDILCAGFPCQPFSKSGYQNGHLDTRGTLFHEIVEVLKRHRPKYVLLENVGNFEQHAGGETWRVAKASLQDLGYQIHATEHVKSGGLGLLSPHHFGFPHSRERFVAVGKLQTTPIQVLPAPQRKARPNLAKVLQSAGDLNELEKVETRLSESQLECINHWNKLVKNFPKTTELPSFPIWGDEFGASYPFENETPRQIDLCHLLDCTRQLGGKPDMTREELLSLLPAYARAAEFPAWKIRFIRQNREWYEKYRSLISAQWLERLQRFSPSLRKLEWNCHQEERDLWAHVLQFRPSGLRAKRMTSIPALVSLTTTQVPIIGPQRRFISRAEGLRLQGFPDYHELPLSRPAAFQALGNAVHVGTMQLVAARLLDDRLYQEPHQMTLQSRPMAQVLAPLEP